MARDHEKREEEVMNRREESGREGGAGEGIVTGKKKINK